MREGGRGVEKDERESSGCKNNVNVYILKYYGIHNKIAETL